MCGGFVDNQIKNGLMSSYNCLMQFVRLATTLLKDEESARDTFLLVTLPNINRLKNCRQTQQ